MKNHILFPIISCLLFSIQAPGQTLDTIYANDHQVVSLSFTDPIQTGMTGSPNYAFSFNREQADNLGLLQAEKGQESNLLVRTTTGNLYAFILAYREHLTLLHYYITPDQSLTNPLQQSFNSAAANDSVKNTPIQQKEHFMLLCTQLLHQEIIDQPWQKTKRYTDQTHGSSVP